MNKLNEVARMRPRSALKALGKNNALQNKIRDSMKKLRYISAKGLVGRFRDWTNATGLRKQKDDFSDIGGKLMNLADKVMPVTRKLNRKPLRHAFDRLKNPDRRPVALKKAMKNLIGC